MWEMHVKVTLRMPALQRQHNVWMFRNYLMHWVFSAKLIWHEPYDDNMPMPMAIVLLLSVYWYEIHRVVDKHIK